MWKLYKHNIIIVNKNKEGGGDGFEMVLMSSLLYGTLTIAWMGIVWLYNLPILLVYQLYKIAYCFAIRFLCCQ